MVKRAEPSGELLIGLFKFRVYKVREIEALSMEKEN